MITTTEARSGIRTRREPAERLGLRIIGHGMHDRRGLCVARESSDAFGLHEDQGVGKRT